MRELNVKALAKINLGLDVLRRRPDGYHDLRMIMQSVRLHDRIYLKMTRTPGIRVKTNVGFLPTNENNLVYRAADLLMQEFETKQGIFIELKKHIPVAAGLAGGSSDAAAVLVGMNRMFGFGLSKEELMERSVKIGADVPFCVLRGTALAEGIGEKLTPLPSPPKCHVLLAKPQTHISTKVIFQNLHADEIVDHPDIDGQIEALRRGDLQELAARMENVLERVTVPLCPVIEQIREVMLREGAAGARMSGSGPTVFGLFAEREQAEKAYDILVNGELARQVYLTEFM